MVRDKRRDQAYFEAFIADQEKRISRFRQTLDQLTQGGAEEERRRQCCLYLENLCWDMLAAQYSRGSGKPVLEDWFFRYCGYVRVRDSLTYNEALNVFSMAILLGKTDTGISAPYPEDAFLQGLESYLKGKAAAGTDSATLAFPEKFREFFQCLRGGPDAGELRSYIERQWYPTNRDEAWHDADKRPNGTYCGYWCFPGAAVAKIRGFPAEAFDGCDYFPIDLLKND